MSYRKQRTTPLDARKIAKVIGIPLNKWHGKCDEVSHAITKTGIVRGKNRYGHYLGPVVETHKMHGYPAVRHGWIELPDGTIVDPTRFQFEGKTPYIYVGKNDYYDVGGNIFRESYRGPPPEREKEEEGYTFPKVSEVENLLGKSDTYTEKQLFYLANLNPARFAENAKAVYSALDKIGFRAFIPIDNWRMIME